MPNASDTKREASIHHHHKNSLVGSVAFTILLLGAIALALRGTSPVIAISTILAVIVLVALFHFAFTASGFFSIIFANSAGVYACIYIVFISSNFPAAQPLSVQTGFVLPLLAFAAGVLGHRRQIQHIIETSGKHAGAPFHGAIHWAGPLLIVAVVTTYLHNADWATDSQDLLLIVSMAVISAIAWFTSKYIALFLIECGVVFRSFLRNARKLAQPVFALLTCYSIITIFFGCIYTILDQVGPGQHFLTNGKVRPLTFLDGLYFSMSTLTMVGFGDILATSPFARLVITGEVLCGVILILFGVEAILDRGRRNTEPH
jgi:voltage-gated potassium channel